MKLTKQQRIEAYEWAAERILERENGFMCNELTQFLVNTLRCEYNDDISFLFEHLPEFNLFEPESYLFAWLKLRPQDKEARLFILGSCIRFAEEAEE